MANFYSDLLNHRASNKTNADKKATHYIWHTKEDGKVRQSHAKRDGKIFAYSNPPKGGHPGEAYGCRCWAEPVQMPSSIPNKDCSQLHIDLRNEELNLENLKQLRDEIVRRDSKYYEESVKIAEENALVKAYKLPLELIFIRIKGIGRALNGFKKLKKIAQHAEAPFREFLDAYYEYLLVRNHYLEMKKDQKYYDIEIKKTQQIITSLRTALQNCHKSS